MLYFTTTEYRLTSAIAHSGRYSLRLSPEDEVYVAGQLDSSVTWKTRTARSIHART